MKDSVFEELTKTIEKQNAIMLKLLRDNAEKREHDKRVNERT